MKNDSKSGLCIKKIITLVATLIIVTSSSIQLFNSKNIQVKNDNIKNENSIQKETQISQTNEREIQVTSRGMAEERNLESEEIKVEEQYISINEIQISKDMDLSKRSGISKEDFKILMSNLKSDTTGFFENNSNIIYDVCEKYEINEIFFSALIVAEAGWNIASSHRDAHNYMKKD